MVSCTDVAALQAKGVRVTSVSVKPRQIPWLRVFEEMSAEAGKLLPEAVFINPPIPSLTTQDIVSLIP